MILHGYFRSSAAFRVRIALGLKGIAPEHRFVHLLKAGQRDPAFRAKNPQALVPVLEDGPAVLTQSLAIIEYLEETHPEPPLLPAHPAERAWVRSIALAIACEIHPLNNLRVLQYLTDVLHVDEATRSAWYRHWIDDGFRQVEAMLEARRGRGPFCLGAAPTVADVCLVPQVFNAQRYHCPLDSFPTVMKVFDTCMKLPAFDLARPARQHDAE
jgi:maleylacetoacetate isomerase